MGYVFDAMNRSDDDHPDQDAFVDPKPQDPPPPKRDDAAVFSLADAARADLDAPAPSTAPPQPAPPQPKPPQAPDHSGDAPDTGHDAPALAFPDPATLGQTARSEFPNQASPALTATEGPPLRMHKGETTRHADDRMVALLSPSHVLSEEYRGIRTGLLARWHHKRHLIHTITSATPQEGKTITSLNLGLSLSELQDRRILVVEADLRLPQFRKLLDLPECPGLTNVLRGEIPIEQAIMTIEETGMDIICAGNRATNDAVQLLSSQKMASLMKLLRRKYDHVIIDTPPVVELADAGIIGAQSDDVLMIVRMERTPRPLVEQAVRTLESYNAPVAGMIATDQHRGRGKYYYYRYGYRYRYRYTERKAA